MADSYIFILSGTFLLTNLLVPTIIASKGQGRIVTLASQGHRLGSLNITDEMNEIQEGFLNGERLYARSKIANILFSTELSRKLKGDLLYLLLL